MDSTTIIFVLLSLICAVRICAEEKQVEFLQPEMKNIIGEDARFEELAHGFSWSEGPVWSKRDAALYFTDFNNNTIWCWKEGKGAVEFLKPPADAEATAEKSPVGPNGLILDAQGRIVYCNGGSRSVERIEQDGQITRLVSHFEKKRLNQPNDLALHTPSGDIFFTDPYFGKKRKINPDKEVDFLAIYRLQANQTLSLVQRYLLPNGVVFSSDAKTLYATDDRTILAFPIAPDGTPAASRLLYTMPSEMEGSFDGMATDARGNIFAANWKGGILVISPSGCLLGILHHGGANANCTFGGKDGYDLYVTAGSRLLRIRTLPPRELQARDR